jgi:NADPH:quinone reductase
MKAAWYERQGAARDVFIVGQMDDPHPGSGEVRVRVAFSGVNPGDVKKREDAFGVGMAYPRVIPHSDGSGTVDAVGDGVSREWIGRRVWCYGAQSYRPFGTAAQYTVVPFKQAVALPEVFRWSRVLVSEFPESLLIVQFMSRAGSTRSRRISKTTVIRALRQ